MFAIYFRLMNKYLLFLAVLIFGVPTAAAQKLESFGQPCRAKQILAGRVVFDRTDQRERFIITNDNEAQGLELFTVDFERNAGEMHLAPAGAGAWALAEVPGDRLLIGTFFGGDIVVFDLKTRKFIKTAKFPGEEYILTLTPGKDGRVYGGTYPGAKLGALDLTTYAVEDLGAPLRLTAPGRGYIYAGADKRALRIDLRTGTVKVLGQAPAAITNIAVDAHGAVYIACEAEVYRLE